MVQEICALRDKGWSHARIGEYMHISSDTARKYAPGGETVRQERNTGDDSVTQEMFAIGEQIIARLRAEGKIDY